MVCRGLDKGRIEGGCNEVYSTYRGGYSRPIPLCGLRANAADGGHRHRRWARGTSYHMCIAIDTVGQDRELQDELNRDPGM